MHGVINTTFIGLSEVIKNVLNFIKVRYSLHNCSETNVTCTRVHINKKATSPSSSDLVLSNFYPGALCNKNSIVNRSQRLTTDAHSVTLLSLLSEEEIKEVLEQLLKRAAMMCAVHDTHDAEFLLIY